MARKFLTNIDLAHNQLLNLRLQVLGAEPSSPEEGWAFYHSTKKEVGVYNGIEWKYLGTIAQASESAFGTIKLAGDLKGIAESPEVKNLHLTGDTAVNHKLTAVSEPTAAADAATKAYVDARVNGLAWKDSVAAATAAALPAVAVAGSGVTHTLTAEANGILEIDGQKIETLSERVLVKNQASEKDNGIYTLTTKGEAGAKFVLTRAEDAATAGQLQDATVVVEKGTENKDTIWNLEPTSITVETTNLKWAKIQSATAIVGDEVYTKRTTNTIELIRATATPASPAEGAVGTGEKGAGAKYVSALKGDGAKVEFTFTHNLGTYLLRVQGLEEASSEHMVPVELDWETSGNNKVVVKFTTFPAAGKVYYVAIWG